MHEVQSQDSDSSVWNWAQCKLWLVSISYFTNCFPFLREICKVYLSFFRKNKNICMKREDRQDATIRCLLLTSVWTCFGDHYAHLQENKGPVTAFGVLFCKMWSLWRFLFNRTETFIVITSCKTAPVNRYLSHPAEPEQHTKCSNRAFVLLKMGIMIPETCSDRS